MFQCLVIRISRDKIYYVHARARYILLSHDSQAYSRVWRKSRFLEHSIGRRQHVSAWALSGVSRLLLHHHRDGRVIWTEPVKS
jgi:hypothetical protein